MKDLLVSPFTPTVTGGAGLRTYGVAAALARHRPVELCYVVFGREQPSSEYERIENLRLRPLHASRGIRRALAYIGARREGTPPALARGVSDELAGAASLLTEDTRVIADGPVAAAALLALARQREIVYLAHNLESAFRGEGPRLDRFEQKLLRTFAESWMATHADGRGARELAGTEIPIRYVPNVIDVQGIAPVFPAESATALFVGDFTYPPNREGLRFLVDDVLPLAWKRREDLRLLVVGRGLERAPEDPRVEALGFVEDLRTAYARAGAVLVPLLHGGGSPLKFLEALAYGQPVVATAHASRLLEEGRAGQEFLAAASAEEFAAALERVLAERDSAAALGAAGRALAERCYSIEALTRLLAG